MLLDLPHVHIFVVMSAWVIISTRCGQKEIVELLIVKGADVNAKGTVRTKVGGVTPLHIAADKGHKEIAELLIDNGADVNVKDDDGETPLDWAIEDNQSETADLLRKHGGKTGEELK